MFGIDPGTATTGWACLEQVALGVKPQLVGCGAIRTSPKTEFGERLTSLYDSIVNLLAEYRPNAVAVEELFFAKNRTTAIAVSHARGVILLAAAQAHLSIADYTPPEVKQALVGYGNADKRQIQAILPAHVVAHHYPKQDDVADAIAVALTHLSVAVNPWLTVTVRAG